MFNHKHYVPVLKGREGEYGALQTLSQTAKNALTPLLEIPPIQWDYEDGTPAKSIDDHLKKVSAKIHDSWGTSHRLFVDLLWLPENERMSDGEHPWEYVFRTARERSLLAVPVVSLVSDHECLEACRKVLELDRRGSCLRIQPEDFEEFNDLAPQVLRTLDTLAVSHKNTDLILDLRELTDRDIESVMVLIHKIPRLGEWRSFTLTATAFPKNLIDYPPSAVSMIERDEWTMWRELLRNRGRLPRIPTFGDYGIAHPQPPEVDPRLMRASASIRYTVDSAWLVLKGKNLRDYDYDQFYKLCDKLILQREYAGPDFSWGDNYIHECAYQRTGTGNLTTWRRVGTSHHLAFVICQLATEFGF